MTEQDHSSSFLLSNQPHNNRDALVYGAFGPLDDQDGMMDDSAWREWDDDGADDEPRPINTIQPVMVTATALPVSPSSFLDSCVNQGMPVVSVIQSSPLDFYPSSRNHASSLPVPNTTRAMPNQVIIVVDDDEADDKAVREYHRHTLHAPSFGASPLTRPDNALISSSSFSPSSPHPLSSSGPSKNTSFATDQAVTPNSMSTTPASNPSSSTLYRPTSLQSAMYKSAALKAQPPVHTNPKAMKSPAQLLMTPTPALPAPIPPSYSIPKKLKNHVSSTASLSSSSPVRQSLSEPRPILPTATPPTHYSNKPIEKWNTEQVCAWVNDQFSNKAVAEHIVVKLQYWSILGRELLLLKDKHTRQMWGLSTREKACAIPEDERVRNLLLDAARGLQDLAKNNKYKTYAQLASSTPAKTRKSQKQEIIQSKNITNPPSRDLTTIKTSTVADYVAMIDSVSCPVCQSNDDDANMLLCDGCTEGGMHIYCHNPPLLAIPEGDWFCSRQCRIKGKLITTPVAVACSSSSTIDQKMNQTPMSSSQRFVSSASYASYSSSKSSSSMKASKSSLGKLTPGTGVIKKRRTMSYRDRSVTTLAAVDSDNDSWDSDVIINEDSGDNSQHKNVGRNRDASLSPSAKRRGLKKKYDGKENAPVSERRRPASLTSKRDFAQSLEKGKPSFGSIINVGSAIENEPENAKRKISYRSNDDHPLQECRSSSVGGKSVPITHLASLKSALPPLQTPSSFKKQRPSSVGAKAHEFNAPRPPGVAACSSKLNHLLSKYKRIQTQQGVSNTLYTDKKKPPLPDLKPEFVQSKPPYTQPPNPVLGNESMPLSNSNALDDADLFLMTAEDVFDAMCDKDAQALNRPPTPTLELDLDLTSLPVMRDVDINFNELGSDLQSHDNMLGKGGTAIEMPVGDELEDFFTLDELAGDGAYTAEMGQPSSRLASVVTGPLDMETFIRCLQESSLDLSRFPTLAWLIQMHGSTFKPKNTSRHMRNLAFWRRDMRDDEATVQVRRLLSSHHEICTHGRGSYRIYDGLDRVEVKSSPVSRGIQKINFLPPRPLPPVHPTAQNQPSSSTSVK